MEPKMESQVFWLTGLPGAGKTTIAKALYEKLKPAHPDLVYLDGDLMRQVFNNFSYDPDSRRQLALSYSRLCHLLSQQNHSVICATVSMFHEVRDWNRQNIENYHEVYIEVPLEVLKQRDQKGLYSQAQDGRQNNVHGINLAFEKPESPDLIVNNDGQYAVGKIVDMILEGSR